MADPNLLAAILSGQDPLAGQVLQGYQGAQLANAALNPEFGHNEGIAGALAKTLAGFTGNPMMNQAVQNTTQARMAAQPELARLLASNDPYKALAANPQTNPVAAAPLLSASPEQVANTRLLNTQAGLGGINLGGYQGIQNLIGAGGQPPTGPIPGRGGGAITGNPGVLGTGRYPQGAAAPDPLAALPNMTPQQRQAALQDPRLRALAIARYRALQQHLSGVNSAEGGTGASRPPA